MLLVNYYICNIDDDVLLDCGLWSGQTSDNAQINIISLTQPQLILYCNGNREGNKETITGLEIMESSE